MRRKIFRCFLYYYWFRAGTHIFKKRSVYLGTMLTCLSLGPGTSRIFSFGFVKNRSTIIYTEKKTTQFAFQYCNEILWIQHDWSRLYSLPVGKNVPCYKVGGIGGVFFSCVTLFFSWILRVLLKEFVDQEENRCGLILILQIFLMRLSLDLAFHKFLPYAFHFLKSLRSDTLT